MYTQLARFLTPLVITTVAHGLGQQVLNGGMARMPRAMETLAAFALALGLAEFLASPLSQIRQVALVLVEDTRSLGTVVVFTLALGALLAAVLLGLGVTLSGAWVIRELHSVGEPLARVVSFALLWLVPYPIIESLLRLQSGLLLRLRRTDVVSVGTLLGIGVSVATVFALLPMPFVEQRPIWLPIIAMYGGLLTEMLILGGGCALWVWPNIRSLSDAATDFSSTDPGRQKPLTLAGLVRFFWPLAVIMAIQGLSRPMVNLFVARGPDGEEALAALAVVYALAHIPYIWLNELRSLPAAFRHLGEDGLSQIRRFSGGCGLVSFAFMLALFWIPPVRDTVLEGFIGLSSDLAQRCHIPLMIFSFFPLVVAPRSYYHGLALLQRRTGSLVPSAPSRIGTTLLALVALPGAAMGGAVRGVAALFCGFVAEGITVWWFVHRRRAASQNVF